MFVFIETVQLSVQAHQISLLRTSPPQPVRERQLDAYYRGQNRYRDSA